jgi:hypothetical protein
MHDKAGTMHDSAERAAIAWSYTAPLQWTADEQRRAVAGLLAGYRNHTKGNDDGR